jgi:RNA polymerase sigma-70 factor (ECF subfamily)
VNAEWECLARAQLGDEIAWCELIRRHKARLKSLALLITGSAAAADDIVQETFVRALRARIRHRTGTVQGFMGTIAYRLALKELKSVQRNQGLGRVDSIDRGHTPLDNVLLNERDRHVADAIRSLDAEHRDVLILRFYADHTYEEIAELLQISLGTVKSRIFYAFKSCRQTLREKGILE